MKEGNKEEKKMHLLKGSRKKTNIQAIKAIETYFFSLKKVSKEVLFSLMAWPLPLT